MKNRRRAAACWIIVVGLGAGCAAPASPAATPTVAQAPTAAVIVNGPDVFAIDPAATTVSYSVDETFLNDNNRLATAVGVTSVVSGTLALNRVDPARSQLGTFTVDLSTLKSDSSRRDNAIRRQWLESATYPLAAFVARGVEGFPASPAEGQDLAFRLLGDLTVRQATRAVTWEVTAQLAGERITGSARTVILMADFGVTPPDIAGILRVKDGVTLTIQFTLLPVE
jgi:polyisoprenoid-binding protein YceI